MLALRIALLILALDSNSFRDREQAFHDLLSLGEIAVPQIAQIKSASQEVMARRQKLLDAQKPRIVARLLSEESPWIDALPFDFPNRCDIIQRYLPRDDVQEDSRSQKGTYPTYRAATRAWVRDMVYRDVPEKEIAALLKVMYSRHPLWGKDADKGWNGWSDDTSRPGE